MRTLGEEAIQNRSRCMESVGWMQPGHKYAQDDWLEFITKLNSVSKPIKPVSINKLLRLESLARKVETYAWGKWRKNRIVEEQNKPAV